MIYLQKSNKRKNKKIIIAVVGVAIFLFIAWLLMVKAPVFLTSTTHGIGWHLWQARIFILDKTHVFFNFFSSKSTLIAENDSLRSEIETLRGKLMNFEVLNVEHAKLLENYGRTLTEKNILAAVLVRPPQTPYDTLILDVGSRLGISAGDIVYSAGGIALGTINDVTAGTAKVVLFSNTNVETSAIIERNDLAVTLHGVGGGGFELQAPQETDILKGDTLIMPTLKSTIVGVVVDVESSVKSAFKRILIKSPESISHLRFVFVERGE